LRKAPILTRLVQKNRKTSRSERETRLRSHSWKRELAGEKEEEDVMNKPVDKRKSITKKKTGKNWS